MIAYQQFAQIYDRLMQDIPYDAYVEWVEQSVGDLKQLKVLDLGCGTGTLSHAMAERGAIVSGVDLSSQMIEVAKERYPSIQFSEGAMQDLNLGDTYDVIVCAIDALNYVTNWEEVIMTFQKVYQHLKPEGRFLFDVHSLEKMAILYEESPFTYDDGDVTYIWETDAGSQTYEIISRLLFYVKSKEGQFERFEEEHIQRTHEVANYARALQETGFTIETITADFEWESPHEESERIFFHVKK